ncbi:hypothetical protein BCR34DRAFT_135215 [Clohesyomyces aquaticus]|uniref:Uncharacterized protein n=1 Tax=Clohesyomyces aquaticus TaxID=1231657 RepID=A0A1Y2AC41_9PLEO|nr:hypothetical protein BCR34DRAFT_135215 [Clohesyomyces aquaticus]
MDINTVPMKFGPKGSHISEEKQTIIPHHPEVVQIAYPTLEAVHPGQLPGEIYAYYEPVKEPWHRRCMSRKRIWLTAIILIITITAVALGTALGLTLPKKKVESGNVQSTPSNPSSSAYPFATTSSIPSPTARPTSIATLSPLAVTAWRNTKSPNNEFSIQLVFQDDQDRLQSIMYNTTFKEWRQTQIAAVAKKSTPLAITRFYHGAYSSMGTPNDEQVELFYLDQKNRLSEWNWDWDANNFTGGPGSINANNFTAASASRLTTYWPFIYYQDQDDYLREIRYSYGYGWHNQSVDTKIHECAALGVVPIAQNNARVGVFYQAQDGRLKEVQRDYTSGDYSYEAHSLSQAIPLPSESGPSPFTAFALTNLTTASALDTYILYQDSSATIQMQWRYEDTGWKGPKTFDALKGADNGTGIACITMETAAASAPTLRVDSDIPRCYFQSGGNVREVEMVRDGGEEEWRVVGYLPIT